jgi:hypothetical protein
MVRATGFWLPGEDPNLQPYLGSREKVFGPPLLGVFPTHEGGRLAPGELLPRRRTYRYIVFTRPQLLGAVGVAADTKAG